MTRAGLVFAVTVDSLASLSVDLSKGHLVQQLHRMPSSAALHAVHPAKAAPGAACPVMVGSLQLYQDLTPMSRHLELPIA